MNNINRDELREIAKNLDIQDILSLCQSSKEINDKLCEDDFIWKYLLSRDYPLSPELPGIPNRLAYTLNHRQLTPYYGTILPNHTLFHGSLDDEPNVFNVTIRGLRPPSGTSVVIAAIKQVMRSPYAEIYPSMETLLKNFQDDKLPFDGNLTTTVLVDVLVDNLAQISLLNLRDRTIKAINELINNGTVIVGDITFYLYTIDLP